MGLLYCQLTDLQLPGNASFALVPEVDLGLVVLGHHLHKLLGQDGVLRGREHTVANFATLWLHFVSIQCPLVTLFCLVLETFGDVDVKLCNFLLTCSHITLLPVRADVCTSLYILEGNLTRAKPKKIYKNVNVD